MPPLDYMHPMITILVEGQTLATRSLFLACFRAVARLAHAVSNFVLNVISF
jgi:hypothetical protein